MELSLLEKTGKSLEEWKSILTDRELLENRDIMQFLKNECNLTHGYANLISLKYRQADAASFENDELIARQFKGKELLLPLYHKLDQIIQNMGYDIEIAPKKDCISYRKKTQFALLKPATKNRIDIGLKLKGIEPQGILEKSGPFGTMCSHRIKLFLDSGLTSEIEQWIKNAYEAN